jgi:2-methylisocitrate lyase-like PEP mutase family enzyme
VVNFRKLHNKNDILIIPNAWDVTSAKIFELSGFQAIGTTSAGI